MSGPTSVAPGVDRNRVHVAATDRTVTIDGREYTGTECDIRIRHGGQTATFMVELWNLTQSSFRKISPGDPVEIELGWDDGPSDTVCRGVVTDKDSHETGGGALDHAYRIRGRSRGAQAARQRVTATYRDATTHEIIHDLANRLDLDVGYLGPPPTSDATDAAPTIEGCWQLRRTRRVRAWLDALVDRAGKATGHQFEWYVDRGRLAFHPKRRVPDDERDVVELSTADEIRKLQPAYGETSHTNDAQPVRALAYCQPAFRKHARLEIAHTTGGKAAVQGGANPDRPTLRERDGTDAVATYRCVTYQFISKTTSGAHTTKALLAPETAKYKYTAPARQRGGR